MPDYAVTAIGSDRPGIVAAITRALLEVEGSIEDSQMSILRGQFAVMLIVRVPDGTSDDELGSRLGAVRDELALEALTFNPVDEPAAARPRPSHVLSVYGADHPGIVHGVAEVLAGSDVNVVGMSTRVVGESAEAIYVMLLEVALPDSLDEAALEELLAGVAERQGVDVSVRPVGGDVL